MEIKERKSKDRLNRRDFPVLNISNEALEQTLVADVQHRADRTRDSAPPAPPRENLLISTLFFGRHVKIQKECKIWNPLNKQPFRSFS